SLGYWTRQIRERSPLRRPAQTFDRQKSPAAQPRLASTLQIFKRRDASVEVSVFPHYFLLSGSNTPVAVNVLPAKEQRFSNEPPLGVLLASVPKQSGPVSPRPILRMSQKALHRHRRPEIAFRPWED